MDRRTALRIIAGSAVAVGAGGLAVFAGRDREAPIPDNATGPAEPTPAVTPAGTPTPADAEEPPPPEAAGHDEPALVIESRCREQWGAAPPEGEYGTHAITRLTVHHSAVAVGGASWELDRLRRFQQHHQEAGFVDLAYHLVVAPDGALYEGRPLEAPGETFTDYDPSGHLHVVLDGDFEREEPTEAQLDTLVAALAWGAGTFDADPATIAGHRDHAATACPGEALHALLADGTIRREVEELLVAGGVALDPDC